MISNQLILHTAVLRKDKSFLAYILVKNLQGYLALEEFTDTEPAIKAGNYCIKNGALPSVIMTLAFGDLESSINASILLIFMISGVNPSASTF